MAAGRLALPTFISQPTDSMAAVDVYTTTEPGVVTNIADITRTIGSLINASLQGGIAAKLALPTINGITKNGSLLINKTNLMARMLSLSPEVATAFRQASTFTSILNGNARNYGSVTASIGGVVARVSGSDLGNIRALGSLVSSITNNSSFLTINDPSAIAGLYSGLVSEASTYGLPNCFSGIAGTLAEDDKNRVATQVLPSAVNNSDLNLLHDMATNTTAGTLLSTSPSVLTDFSTGYASPTECTVNDQVTNFSKMTSAYSAVDPTWDSTTRNGEEIVDLTTLQGGSGDFANMVKVGAFESTNDDDKLYLLAEHFPATDVNNELSSQYPKTYYSEDLRSTVVA